MTFDQIPIGATIRIYTLTGTLVKDIGNATGNVVWDVKNDSGEDVASGIYFARISGSGGEKTIKIVVQR